jgi:UTP-glucose-1-phosphate uridylyltransferase
MTSQPTVPCRKTIASRIDYILIVTGKNKRLIEDNFDRSYELEYTLQRAGKDRDLKKSGKIVKTCRHLLYQKKIKKT